MTADQMCTEPMGPMAVGALCRKCGHHPMYHSDDGGPCARCEMREVLQEMRELAAQVRQETS